MAIALPLIVALAGVLMYGFCVNEKLQKIGLVSYGVGMLAFLLTSAQKLIEVIK